MLQLPELRYACVQLQASSARAQMQVTAAPARVRLGYHSGAARTGAYRGTAGARQAARGGSNAGDGAARRCCARLSMPLITLDKPVSDQALDDAVSPAGTACLLGRCPTPNGLLTAHCNLLAVCGTLRLDPHWTVPAGRQASKQPQSHVAERLSRAVRLHWTVGGGGCRGATSFKVTPRSWMLAAGGDVPTAARQRP